MDLQRDFGYSLRGPEDEICRQCHGLEEAGDFDELHEKHVKDKGLDCSWCHGFSRPELGLEVSPMVFIDPFESGGLDAWER